MVKILLCCKNEETSWIRFILWYNMNNMIIWNNNPFNDFYLYFPLRLYGIKKRRRWILGFRSTQCYPINCEWRKYVLLRGRIFLSSALNRLSPNSKSVRFYVCYKNILTAMCETGPQLDGIGFCARHVILYLIWFFLRY